MSEKAQVDVGRIDRRYMAAVVVTLGGAITFAGPWPGYWEATGLFLFATGAIAWVFWEGMVRV